MLKNILFVIVLHLLMTICTHAQEKTYILQGVVSDIKTGDALEGATIFFIEPNKKITTDRNGEYKISLPANHYTVQVSYVGYQTSEFNIDFANNETHNVPLVGNINIKEVIVVSNNPEEKITRVAGGVEKLNRQEIKAIPALMGEVDIVKAIQLLPGVQATSEGGSGFSVRGGAPDQNLILIDNAAIYNPSHLLGFFSIFNNDVISGLELFKGDFPMKYGGRLSSLLDVETKNSMPDKIQGVAGIGLISSRIMAEGPIGNKTSWLVGARRSYADLFLKLSSDEELNKSKLYFYDLNAKISHRFSNKNRIDLSAYYGRDVFGADGQLFKYGNAAATLAWTHRFSEKTDIKLSLIFSNYNYNLSSKMQGAELSWKSGIIDVGGRMDFTSRINNFFNLTYGVTSTIHQFSPATIQQPNYDDFVIDKNYALEHGVYFSNEQKISSKLSVRYGVRLSVFQNIGNNKYVFRYDENYNTPDSTYYKRGKIYNTQMALEPRIGAVYMINEQSSAKMSYVHNVQFLQIANNSAAGSPLDLWFPASTNIKPQKVDMFSVGYFRNFANNMYETSIEVYYKNMKNVIDFADHSQLILNKKLEGEIRTGKGKAYGVELMIKKNSGRLTGFVNYTLSRTERTIAGINNGKTYLAPYDKTHVLNIFANYKINKKHSISATFIYATGNPTTYPTGRFEINGTYYPIYSGRNEYRRPDYNRLDLSWTYVPKPEKKRWRGEWNFSVYNAYWKKNPWTIVFDTNDNGIPYAEMVYLFGIIPSISFNINF